MADAGDLKSPVATRAGSNPAPGTGSRPLHELRDRALEDERVKLG